MSSFALENICASHPILACDLISNACDGTIEVTLIIPRRCQKPQDPLESLHEAVIELKDLQKKSTDSSRPSFGWVCGWAGGLRCQLGGRRRAADLWKVKK